MTLPFRRRRGLAFILSLILNCHSALAETDFFFQWPASTAQCDVVQLTWSNAVSPVSAWVVPIYGQPFIYNIPDSAISNGYGSYNISLQLTGGQQYTVIMSDGRGLGSGGSAEIQVVGASNSTACLSTASSNSTSLDFTFTISGQILQCERGFEMSWSGGREDGPYNATFIPLDQGFNAFDVKLEETLTYESDWVVNMTAGSRFTVMMNSKQGYGRGGITGVYQVGNSNDSSCISQTQQPTGTWPVSLGTNSIDAATLAITESASVSHSKLSKGAIAGVVVGVVAVLAIVGLALFYLLRRRKRGRTQSTQYVQGGDGVVDLADKADGDDDTPYSHGYGPYDHIEPYEQYITAGTVQTHGSSNTGSGISARNQSGTATALAPDSASLSAASAAGAGAGSGASAGAGSAEEGSDGGPGVAGPLPTKSRPAPSSSSSLSSTNIQRANPSSAPTPTPAPLQSELKWRNPIPGMGFGAGARASPQSSSQSLQRGSMQVVNHDNPESIPALPPGAMHVDNSPNLGFGRGRRAHDQPAEYYGGRGPTFRRHADAGRVDEEIVDLPPMYTDVPRDNAPHSASASASASSRGQTPINSATDEQEVDRAGQNREGPE